MDRIGRYKIVRELGRGAMGVVYHAIDPNIGRPVAIKTIQLGGGRKPEELERLSERLFREARSAGGLSHPGIVTVYDVEQQAGGAYIAMEYVDGPTLDHLLSEPQAMAPDRMFGVLAQTAAALDYAHQKGIVHRDIKPANIMIAADGMAKITDFGIAKINAPEQFTMTGAIVGTPHYMSPEQVQGQSVDGRSDQFSLAVIAFEMLTGEKPYEGEHLTAVVYKIVAEEPVAPHRLNSTLSGAIENVLRKGLAKKADARYRTCTEFISALEKACAATEGWKALPRGAGSNEPTVAGVGAEAAVKMPAARRPRRSGGTTTVERPAKTKSGFLPFLFAILMAGALLALIGWQAAPWLSPNQGKTSAQREAAKGEDTSTLAASNSGGGQTADGKPSPMPPPPATLPAAETKPADAPAQTKSVETQPEQKPPDQPVTKPVQPVETPKPPEKAQPEPPVRRPPVRAGGPQPVRIISSPSGATAILDGRADTSCSTPCALLAAPGRHTVAITKAGYQIEHREVEVGAEPDEMPAVMLRMQLGTLLLSSSPPGAAIRVNGKLVTETTPAQLSLAPGSYTITLEKNGVKSTDTVEIKNGDMRRLQVSLGQ